MPSDLFSSSDIANDPYSPKILYKLEKGIKEIWWVLLFVLLCYCVYEQAYRDFLKEYDRLNLSLQHLMEEEEKALAIQENLIRQIESQSDQAWVEITLMKGLGLVPEGYTKIYFESATTSKN